MEMINKIVDATGLHALKAIKENVVIDNPHELTLGQRNNNPINIKAFDNWDGMTGQDEYGHAIFKNLDYGIRAAYKNFDNHIKGNPDQSLLDYFNTFAEENGGAEAKYIADKLGVSVNSKLNMFRPEDILVHSSKFESKTDITPEGLKNVMDKFGLGIKKVIKKK